MVAFARVLLWQLPASAAGMPGTGGRVRQPPHDGDWALVGRGKSFRRGGSGGPAGPPAGAGGGCGVGGVLLGPRTPLWACSCGEVSNWASRCACRRCGSWASISTRDKAKAADAAARKGLAAAGGSQVQASPSAAKFKEVQSELQEAKRRIKELEAKAHKQPAAAAGGGPGTTKG